tara:strand:- start:174 stop:515 length:342 start_codon:yes stop_codon:yes gene_type:complete
MNKFVALNNALKKNEVTTKLKKERECIINDYKSLNKELEASIKEFDSEENDIMFKANSTGTISAFTYLNDNRLSCSGPTHIEALNQLLKLKKFILENPTFIKGKSSIFISSHI